MVDRIDDKTRPSLLLRLQDPQSSSAWNEFVAEYGDSIVLWCRRMGLQLPDAEDVAQGVLLRLVSHIQTFSYDPKKSFRGWLRIVTKNAVMDYYKSAARHPKGSGQTSLHQALNNLADYRVADELHVGLSASMIRRLLGEAEEQVRPRVSEQTWAAYALRVSGKSARDVAAELDMRVGAVHKAKSRVVRMLRNELAALTAGTN